MGHRWINGGALGGLALTWISIIGMVEVFHRKQVIAGVLDLGTLLLPVALGGAAWHATGGAGKLDSRVRVSRGLLAGLLAAGIAVAFTAYVDVVQPRGVFPNASPALVTSLRFGLEPVTGSGVLLLLGAALGGAVAAIRLSTARVRRALGIGLGVVLAVALMERFVGQMLSNVGLGPIASLAFGGGGLTPPAALLIGGAGAAMAWSKPRRLALVRRRAISDNRALAVAVSVVVAAALPWIVGIQLADVLTTVGIYVLLGLGLNIVVGFAGLLDLGYVAFYAIGAYCLALLTSPAASLALEFGFWAALPLIVLVAALGGLLIGAPVLRLRGDYLAIVTLGLGEIARLVLLSDWLKPYLGGAQGIVSIPAPELAGITLRGPQTLYYLVVIMCIGAGLAAWRLADSRTGRAWNAMREDEVAAEATGVNTHRSKLLAFALGASIGSLGGVLFAAKVGSVFPHSFDLLVSINALALIILGGIGSIPGVVLGAFVLVGLPELLREFAEYRLLIYGAVLVGMMLLRPEGLLPNRTRSAELHEREDVEEKDGQKAGEATKPVVTA